MDSLVEVRENPHVETGEVDPLSTARRNLKQRVADKGDALTPAERKFLTDLADSVSAYFTLDTVLPSTAHSPLHLLAFIALPPYSDRLLY